LSGEGFRKLLESTGFKGKMPQLIACGSRDSTYRDFKTEHTRRMADYVAMLVDSEEPVNDPEKTWGSSNHQRLRLICYLLNA